VQASISPTFYVQLFPTKVIRVPFCFVFWSMALYFFNTQIKLLKNVVSCNRNITSVDQKLKKNWKKIEKKDFKTFKNRDLVVNNVEKNL
jgi:hypothetical protein